MLKHIVMWKFKDFAEGKSKEQNLEYVKGCLESLRSLIPQIKFLEFGINSNKSDMAFDAVLYTEFADEKDLEFYQNHPEHRAVSAYVSKIRTARSVVDYFV